MLKSLDAFWNGRRKTTPAPEVELRRILWSPFESLLEGVDTVIIIPDDELCRLPWNALPGRNPLTYLIEEMTLSTAAHGRQVAAILQSQSPERPKRMLVVGGVDYDTPQPERRSLSAGGEPLVSSLVRGAKKGEVWASLPYAAAEASAIADTANSILSVRHLTGQKATEREVLRELRRSHIAHFATHGYFSESNGRYQENLREASLFSRYSSDYLPGSTVRGRNPYLMSGIVLAGANQPNSMNSYNDGILTAEECLSYALRHINLVTLAACDSALGHTWPGTSVTGFQKSMHQSGVRSVVAGLWKVPSGATEAIMKRFYASMLHGGMSRSQALREAQLYVLNHNRLPGGLALTRSSVRKRPVKSPATATARTEPWFWAAWTLSGDWR